MCIITLIHIGWLVNAEAVPSPAPTRLSTAIPMTTLLGKRRSNNAESPEDVHLKNDPYAILS